MHISICLNVIYKVGSLQIIQTIIIIFLILIISLHITDKYSYFLITNNLLFFPFLNYKLTNQVSFGSSVSCFYIY
jgi:hypothetical protein